MNGVSKYYLLDEKRGEGKEKEAEEVEVVEKNYCIVKTKTDYDDKEG